MKKQCGLTNAETVDLQTTIRSPSPSQRAQIKWAAIHRQQQLKHRIHMHQGIKTIYQTRWRTLWLRPHSFPRDQFRSEWINTTRKS
jgi:hypothetical protein